MCGIFGSVSNNNVVTSLIDGLYSLEYRGYDSCGLALQDDKIKIYKALGKNVSDFENNRLKEEKVQKNEKEIQNKQKYK